MSKKVLLILWIASTLFWSCSHSVSVTQEFFVPEKINLHEIPKSNATRQISTEDDAKFILKEIFENSMFCYAAENEDLKHSNEEIYVSARNLCSASGSGIFSSFTQMQDLQEKFNQELSKKQRSIIKFETARKKSSFKNGSFEFPLISCKITASTAENPVYEQNVNVSLKKNFSVNLEESEYSNDIIKFFGQNLCFKQISLARFNADDSLAASTNFNGAAETALTASIPFDDEILGCKIIIHSVIEILINDFSKFTGNTINKNVRSIWVEETNFENADEIPPDFTIRDVLINPKKYGASVNLHSDAEFYNDDDEFVCILKFISASYSPCFLFP